MSAVDDLLDELLGLAIGLAAKAAALLVDGLDHVRLEVSTKSSPTDMVTEMDRASEALIVDGIRSARPDDGIVGEEGADHHGRSGVRWLIDPIDGTTNYLYAFPGLRGVDRGRVPRRGRRRRRARSVASRGLPSGKGSGRHAQRPADPGVDGGRSATGARRHRLLLRTRAAPAPGCGTHECAPHVRDIRRMGAAAVDLCSVACGRLDAFYERGLGPWDLAAGALIAREAGATVGDLAGGPPSGEFVLASSTALFDPLRALLDTAGAGTA